MARNSFFAIFRKNVSDRFTGRFGNIVIDIDEFAAELLGKQRANSALAARRHSDNHDIALFERDFLDNLVNDFIADLLVLPQLACRLRLSDEHGQAAYMRNAELFGLKHEARSSRVIHHIDNAKQAIGTTLTQLARARERLEVDRENRGSWETCPRALCSR